MKVDEAVRDEWLRTIEALQGRIAEGFRLDAVLRGNLERVRDFRNSFVHSGTVPPATFTFHAALSWFNTFLARLPDPLT